jgi:hypothetical protein
MHELRRAVRLALIYLLALAAGASATAPGVAFAQFGVASFSSSLSSNQAGAHADFTTSFALNTEALGNPDEQLRDVAVTLPAGLIGNPSAIERCSLESLQELRCSPHAQVGELSLSLGGIGCRGVATTLVASVDAGATTLTVPNAEAFCAEQAGNVITVGDGATAETATVRSIPSSTTLEMQTPLEHAHSAGEPVTHLASATTDSLPLFNIQPAPGHVATFAASLLIADVFVQVDVGEDGSLIATIDEASTIVPLQGVTVTLWGVPAESSHNALRCNELGDECGGGGGEPVPFLANPTSCAQTPKTTVNATSWQGSSASSTTTLPPMTGCEQLTIAPTLTVASGSGRRDSPAGYEIQLEVPQNETPNGLATPAIEKVSITLPAGTSLSPALGSGLQACEETQLEHASCAAASEVGTAEVASPLLPELLRGAIYIGTPTPTEPYRVFLRVVAGSTVIDLQGEIEADDETGQLTTVFRDTPELPLAKLKLRFFGGPTAALANPMTCGPATSTGSVTSYAGQTVNVSSTFEVDEDSEGGACPLASPFAPSFTAGTTNAQAGHTSPFVLSISRADGQQYLSSFTVHLPSGLIGLIGSVPLCQEPAAAAGACPQTSEVGSATVAAGPGPLPLYVTGPVYLTGSHDGAPFGLEIAADAIVGPFDLGTVIVRSRILVDPSTLAITIASDPFPQIVGGVSLRLRSIEVSLDRAGFMVNPTSCSPQSIDATITSSEGAAANLSAPFRVADCRDLAFEPRIAASTQAQASEQGDGAGVDVDITEPASPMATIRSIHVEMPGRLRPRLSTIQHACLVRAQPTSTIGCPAQSVVGHATVRSVLTASPLSGPVYLVAHGGTTLPSLVARLQEEGLEVDLEGTLGISSKNVISAVFDALPDVPVESFDLDLQRGPNSLLGAVTGLCRGKSMKLAYAFRDQGEALVNGNAPVTVSGCAPNARRHHQLARMRRMFRQPERMRTSPQVALGRQR